MAGFDPENWTIVRAVGVDGNGDPLPGAATEILLEGCLYVPGTSTEMNLNAEQVEGDATLYVPAGQPEIRASDRLRRPGGEEYDVIGRPRDFGTSGTLALLKFVTG